MSATSGGLAAVSLRALHRPVAVTVTSNAIKGELTPILYNFSLRPTVLCSSYS